MPKKGGRRRKKRTHVVENDAAGSALVTAEETKVPRSLVVRRGKVESEVVELVSDLRHLMMPYTALNFQEDTKSKKLSKSLEHYSKELTGTLGLSHILSLSQNKEKLAMRLARTPSGPTLTFKIQQFSLSKSVRKVQRRPFDISSSKITSYPPIVVTNNFGDQTASPHVKLMRITFQNMFPALNVATIKLRNCRRVVLFNYIRRQDSETGENANGQEEEDEEVEVRHYAIRANPVGIDKKVRRIIQAKIPNLSKLEDISDYITGTTASGAPAPAASGAMSDSEAEDETSHVVLPDKYAGRGNNKAQKSALKLVELGPRLRMKLTKVERGLASGDVMYHSYVHKDPKEAKAIKENIEKAAMLKKRRREEQEENVRRKKAAQQEKLDRKKARRAEREKAAMKELRGGVDKESSDSESSDEEYRFITIIKEDRTTMSTPSEKQTPKMTRNPQQDEETTALTPPPERSSRRVPMKYLKAILILIVLLVLIILSSVNIKLSRSAEQNKTTLDSIVVALKTLDAKIESTQAELSKSIKENNSDMNVLSDRLFPKTIQMSSIQNHACALSALTIKCVGQNDHGCLGIDPSLSLEPFQETSTPITLQLSYSLIPTKVVTGESYTCILTTYKTVYCLGWNDNGQLGDNTRTDSFTPIRVRKENGSPLEDVIDIEAGLKHTCAILSSGLMYCWGAKRGKDPNSPEISNLLLGWNDEVNIDVAMMALSHLATCVVLKSNTSRVKCKGDTDISGFSFCFEHNQSFNLGQEIIKLTSGDVGNHFCALLVDGTAKCFGCNVDGQLGNGSKEHLDKFAMPVLEELSRKPLSGITDINAGFKSTCLISNGTPMCFGDNAHHQLGMAFRADGVYPHTLDVTLPADKDAVSVHVGRYTGHVVYSDNSVYAWGSNMYGTLGDGSEIGVEADTIGDELGEEAVEILFNF